MPRRMSAKAMGWIGALLVVVGVLPLFLFDTVAFMLWDPSAYASLYANETLGYVRLILGAVVLPLGIGFVALSIAARHLDPRGDNDKGVRIPPRLGSRSVLWLGIALAAAGFVLQESLDGWLYELSGDGGGILLDFLRYAAFPLQPVIIPLGILLVPCSFLIAALEAHVAEDANVPADRTVQIISRPSDAGPGSGAGQAAV